MEADRLTSQLHHVQVVPAAASRASSAAETPPNAKKCTISNLVMRPPVNIEFHDLKFTTHTSTGGKQQATRRRPAGARHRDTQTSAPLPPRAFSPVSPYYVAS